MSKREGLAAKWSQGARLGRRVGLPAEVRDRIVDERAAGTTMRAIADGLNIESIPTARGGTDWRSGTVAAVLDSLQRDAERLAVLANLGQTAA